MAKLVLVRHGQSEWNKLGLWTGWNDVSLTEEGKEEAREAGRAIKNIHFDYAFTSDLKRAQETLAEIVHIIGPIPTTIAPEMKERDYGDLAGKNKWKLKDEYGEDQFTKWRRGWDEPIPHGETLKMVYDRAIPYFKLEILPKLEEGKNVLITAHGNSLRALVKYLENIPDADIPHLEIATGEVYEYDIDEKGNVIHKQVLAARENKA